MARGHVLGDGQKAVPGRKLLNPSPGQNQMNRAAQRNNRLGVKGIYWYQGKYVATISDGEKKRYLGRFSKLVDAIAAYNKASEELQGEYGRQTKIIHVNVTKYGDGPLPANQVQVGSDGTVVDISCIKYEPLAHGSATKTS